MTALETLEKHPKVTKALATWMIDKTKDSIPEGPMYEEYLKYLTDTLNTRITNIVEINPRLLFDFFDEYEMYITTSLDVPHDIPIFSTTVNRSKGKWYPSRIEAEKEAIEVAFSLLEEKL